MKVFSLRPTVYFGPGALEALEELGGKRVFVVTDAFLSGSGLLDRVREHLKDCEIRVFDAVKPDPSLRLVAEGVAALRQFSPGAVVAFGGGSPMDCAKAIRHFSGLSELPFYAVPTTAGTGSEVTAFSVLTDEEAGVKVPLVDPALLPDAAVLEPSFLTGVPAPVTADTGMDVLAHALESYVARGANPFTDAMAEKAFSLAWEELPRACRGNGEARGRMLLASCLAGIAFNEAGLGICHGLAHVLGGKFHTPHGRLNAVLLPQVIRYNAQDGEAGRKYARLARLIGLSPTPRALAGAAARLRESLGMPGSLTACGIKAEELSGCEGELARAALGDVCTPGNPRLAGEEALCGLIRESA